ncbi:MAG TPA: L,D-transpeptidase family protein [Chitinophagaceae bacterium]|nr:L,D-transpeptidase family protein [Chitinophagaceae bacterium]
MRKNLLFLTLLCFLFTLSASAQSFLAKQLRNPRFETDYELNNNKLKKEFEKKGLTYPANYIFIRSFKYDSRLEVWVKDKAADTFQLFKNYNVCALSGYLGRKLQQGDSQVPEGFYYINRFQPNSAYHLSLKINYPNFSDLKNTPYEDPGGGIYIHGSCVTVGCIPIRNEQIDEVYLLAVLARNAGQSFIPVHVLPVDFDNNKSVKYLDKNYEKDHPLREFWSKLKIAYHYFNKTHKLPLVLYDGSGDYVVKKSRKQTAIRKNYSKKNYEAMKKGPMLN